MHAHPLPSPQAFQTFLRDQMPRSYGVAGEEAELTVAWQSYLGEIADKLELGLTYMDQSYDALREYLSTFSLPLFSAALPDQFGLPTTWSKELQEDYDKLVAMAHQTIIYLREGQNGERGTSLLADDQWGLEAKDGDPFAIAWDKNTKALVMVPAPAPSVIEGKPSGAVNGPEIAAAGPPGWFLFAAVVIIGALIYVLYVAITGMYETIKKIIEQHEIGLIYKCLNEHKPEDCQNAQAAVESLKKLNIEREKVTQPKDPAAEISKVLTTAAWVALVGGGLYLGLRFLPPLLDDLGSKKKPA